MEMLQLLNTGNSHWQGRRCDKDVTCLECSSPGKHLWVQVDIKLNMSQQCIFAGLKDHSMRQSIASRWREVILPLHPAMVRPHLECCNQCWAPQYKRDSSKGQLRWLRNRSIFPTRKADKARTVQPGEASGESHQAEVKLHREWSQALSVVLSNTSRAQSDTGGSLWTWGSTFCEGDWSLAQVAPGDCRDSIPGEIQKLFGHNPGQVAPHDHGGWKRWPQRCLPTPTTPRCKCWRFNHICSLQGHPALYASCSYTSRRDWQMSPPPLYIYIAHRTLFLQTRDWQQGQMCWGMAAQSRISIKTVWDASTAKRSNNWARLCQQFTPAQHCATNTSIPALLSCQQKFPMGWFTQLLKACSATSNEFFIE